MASTKSSSNKKMKPTMELKVRIVDKESLTSITKLLRNSTKGRPQQPFHLYFSKGNFPPHFDASIDHFLKALMTTQDNVNITTISIQPDFLKAFAFPATAIRFCRTIGRIPSLSTIQLVPGQRHIPMSTQHLATILQEARNKLQNLICQWTVFGGATQDFIDLAAAIEGHPTLTKLSFQSCVLIRRNRSLSCMDPVLRAFRAVPNLQELALSCWIPYGWIEQNDDRDPLFQLVAKACRHPTLQDLTLQESLGRIGLEPTLTAIEQSQTLRVVSLEAGKLGLQECTLLGKVIRNNTNLERLSLSIQGGANLNDEHLTHVLQALKTNTTLTSLTIRSGPSRFNYVPSTAIQKEILSMVESNLTLKEFKLTPRPQRVDSFLLHLEHYLALNKAGRKYLLEHPDAGPSEWLKVLSGSTHHASAIYHFLSQNPMLCKMDRKRKALPRTQEDEESRPAKKRRVD